MKTAGMSCTGPYFFGSTATVDVILDPARHLPLDGGASAGNTALHLAINSTSAPATVVEKVVNVLVQSGARGFADWSGWTPYDVARELDRPPIVQSELRLPLSKGCDDFYFEIEVIEDGVKSDYHLDSNSGTFVP